MNCRLWQLLIAGGVLALVSTARASDDWEYWNQFVFKHEFTDRVALDVASEQKWLDDASDFYQYNATVLPTVKPHREHIAWRRVSVAKEGGRRAMGDRESIALSPDGRLDHEALAAPMAKPA